MAISAYTGLPRSGKSYGVFENVIIPALKKGRLVYTNIPFNERELLDYAGSVPVPFDAKDIQDNPDFFQERIEPGGIVVIDECWRVWSAGTRATAIPEGHKSFFAEHGHMVNDLGQTTQIVLVTQDLAQIASFCRLLVETTYRATKLSAVGASNKYRIDIYTGAVTGQNPPKSAMINQLFGTYKPEVYQCYKSATMSETGNVGNEKTVDTRGNVFKGMVFKVIPFVVLGGGLVVWLGWQSVSTFFNSGGDPDSVQVEQVKQVTSTISVPQKPEHIDHLKGRDLTIVSNNGRSPAEYDYVIEAKKGDSWYRLTKPELLKLGYTINPINQCLAVLKMAQSTYAVTCRSQKGKAVVDFNFAGSSEDSGA